MVFVHDNMARFGLLKVKGKISHVYSVFIAVLIFLRGINNFRSPKKMYSTIFFKL